MFPAGPEAEAGLERVLVTAGLGPAGLGPSRVELVPAARLSVRVVGPVACRLGEELGLRVVVRGAGSGRLKVALAGSRRWQEVGGGPAEVAVGPGAWRRVVRVAVRVLHPGRVAVRAIARWRGISATGALEVAVAERGFPASLHSSVQLGLGRNSYSLQTFSVAALGDNTVTLSLSSDRLGPPLPAPALPSLNCEAAAARLATLVHHLSYAGHRRRQPAASWPAQLVAAYQELISCQHPAGGFSFHFGSPVLSVWVTAVAVDALGRAAREPACRGLAVDSRAVAAGAGWLVARQGAGGEWGEGELFPDQEQAPVEFQPTAVTAQVVATLASLGPGQKVRCPFTCSALSADLALHCTALYSL
jgi:hypothetical protein